jgi:hypothetical protein
VAIDVHREVVQNPRRSINGLRPYPRHARDGSRTCPKIRVCEGRSRQTPESSVGAESASSHERSPGSS